MNRLLRVSYVILVATLLLASSQVINTTAKARQDETKAVVLKGLDPVALLKGKEVKGKEEFSTTRGEFRYLFASEENKSQFEKDLKRYEIQLNGSCAVMPQVPGDPDRFMVYQDKIYVFGTDDCVTKFKANPTRYVN